MKRQNIQGYQTIAATVIVSGPQTVHIDTHGTGGAGSHITVSTPNLMVSVHGMDAAKTYHGAWTDSRESAVYLPSYRPVEVEPLSARLPGVVVRAYGMDKVNTVFNPTRAELLLRIGYLTWIVVDKEAHHSMTTAWDRVMEMGKLVLPYQRPRKA